MNNKNFFIRLISLTAPLLSSEGVGAPSSDKVYTPGAMTHDQTEALTLVKFTAYDHKSHLLAKQNIHRLLSTVII